MIVTRLARLRVPLGFVTAGVAFWFAQPTPEWIVRGMSIAALGEAVRIWAAGHIEKGREITRSGPYRYVRHPLYLGSAIMAVGFAIAANDLAVALVVAAYVALTVGAAMKIEEAVLDERFTGEYSAYREGRARPVERPFSLARVWRNREHRAVIGLIAAVGLLYLRWYLRTAG